MSTAGEQAQTLLAHSRLQKIALCEGAWSPSFPRDPRRGGGLESLFFFNPHSHSSLLGASDQNKLLCINTLNCIIFSMLPQRALPHLWLFLSVSQATKIFVCKQMLFPHHDPSGVTVRVCVRVCVGVCSKEGAMLLNACSQGQCYLSIVCNVLEKGSVGSDKHHEETRQL